MTQPTDNLTAEAAGLAELLQTSESTPIDPNDPRLRTLWRLGRRLARQGGVTHEFDVLREQLGLEPFIGDYRAEARVTITANLSRTHEAAEGHDATPSDWHEWARVEEMTQAVREVAERHGFQLEVSGHVDLFDVRETS